MCSASSGELELLVVIYTRKIVCFSAAIVLVSDIVTLNMMSPFQCHCAHAKPLHSVWIQHTGTGAGKQKQVLETMQGAGCKDTGSTHWS